MTRISAPLALLAMLAGLAAGCSNRPPADLSAPGGPAGLVSTQTPPGTFLTESGRRPLQTRNSLPPGAGVP